MAKKNGKHLKLYAVERIYTKRGVVLVVAKSAWEAAGIANEQVDRYGYLFMNKEKDEARVIKEIDSMSQVTAEIRSAARNRSRSVEGRFLYPSTDVANILESTAPLSRAWTIERLLDALRWFRNGSKKETGP